MDTGGGECRDRLPHTLLHLTYFFWCQEMEGAKMKRTILLLLSLILVFSSCEDEKNEEKEPETNTVTFKNKTAGNIEIEDNSGRDMFAKVTVFSNSTKTLTYVCPEGGSCTIDFMYSWRGSAVCICTGQVYNSSYTFGKCPDNSFADASQRCTSCSNSACN